MPSFSQVPESARASEIYIELRGVRESLASLFIPPTGGMIGQYDPAKTAVVDYERVKVVSADDVGNKAGFGSHAHRIALQIPPAVFLQGGGVYWFPVPEDGAASAADETITIVGTATSAGTLFILVGSDLLSVGIPKGSTETEIAAAIATAITADQNLPVSAVSALGVATLTAKFKGTAGNQIKLVLNPGGEVQENKAPAGITVALENADGYLDGGSTDPSVESVFFDGSGNDKLGDEWYTDFNLPYTDAANIAHHVASGEARKDPAVNRFFGSQGGYTRETLTQALNVPATINSEWIDPIWENRLHAPAFELSAQLFGTILDEKNKAPNRPYKTLEVDLPVDSSIVNRRTAENDALFRAGMGYCKIDSSGKLRLGDIATSYRTNDSGGATEEWFDAVTRGIRQAKAYSLEQLFLGEDYQRSVVVDDASPTKISFARKPKDIIADVSKLINELWAPFGWTKNADEVIASLTAEINSGFAGRLDGGVVDDDGKALRIVAFDYAYKY